MKERPLGKIIPFAGRGRGVLPEVPAVVEECVAVAPWNPLALDSADLPRRELVAWLDDALIEAKVRELAFLRALGGVPVELVRPELRRGPLAKFHEVGLRLTLALEMLRIGQVGPAEVRVLYPGLARAWVLLRSLREAVLEDLEPKVRHFVQQEERSSQVGPEDVEHELQVRSHRRTLGDDLFSRRMVVPGGYLLDMPDRPEIELRSRRERRLAHDNRPINVDLDLAGWLEELPREWLEGIARGLGLPFKEDRWEQERCVHQRLLSVSGLRHVMRCISPIERRIISMVLEQGGFCRYDAVIMRYGGDDETAWHWAEEIPTSALERVRRTGLVYAGQAQVGRKCHRLAVVPLDLRPLAARILNFYR